MRRPFLKAEGPLLRPSAYPERRIFFGGVSGRQTRKLVRITLNCYQRNLHSTNETVRRVFEGNACTQSSSDRFRNQPCAEARACWRLHSGATKFPSSDLKQFLCFFFTQMPADAYFARRGAQSSIFRSIGRECGTMRLGAKV